jgi:hypothetical protein
MLQDKRAKEEEVKGGQQAELNRPERGQLVALAIAALPQALPEAPAGVSPSQRSLRNFGFWLLRGEDQRFLRDMEH